MTEDRIRMQVTEDEFSEIIKQSGGRPVHAAFGPWGVKLDLASSGWAKPIVERLRGKLIEDGAGI